MHRVYWAKWFARRRAQSTLLDQKKKSALAQLPAETSTRWGHQQTNSSNQFTPTPFCYMSHDLWPTSVGYYLFFQWDSFQWFWTTSQPDHMAHSDPEETEHVKTWPPSVWLHRAILNAVHLRKYSEYTVQWSQAAQQYQYSSQLPKQLQAKLCLNEVHDNTNKVPTICVLNQKLSESFSDVAISCKNFYGSFICCKMT